ncbi:hypothetical protein CASFOL_040027 [Castilleja foliolosa]|uniref:Uncharacterized protein n=1 Tax=Castilleja foliolosa TaxID=1961234 RepID=A0ABD3BFP6_9LAMI
MPLFGLLSNQSSMDDLLAYYAPSIHQPPPAPPPPATVAQPIYITPQFIGYAPLVYPQSPEDQVRTLFVAGPPEDVKPREIYHLFRECPGYQSSNLRPPTSSNNQCIMMIVVELSLYLVKFEVEWNCQQPTDHLLLQLLWMALHAINGIVFDLEKGSTLHIDLAKSNSRSKHDGSEGAEKKLKGSSSFLWNDDPGYSSVHTPGMANPSYNTIAYPSTQRCRGFLKLKMQGTYGAPVAFVDLRILPVRLRLEVICKAQFSIPQRLAKGCVWSILLSYLPGLRFSLYLFVLSIP